MITHSSILAWGIPWQRSLESYSPWGCRVEHNWSDFTHMHTCIIQGLPWCSDSKESVCYAGDLGSVIGLGWYSGERNGYPLQYSCLENSTDKIGWWAIVLGVEKSQTQLRKTHTHTHTHTHTCYSRISQVALEVKNLSSNTEDARDMGSIPRLGRSPGAGHGNPLQYSCLENSMERGAWWAAVHGVTKSRTWLKQLSVKVLFKDQISKIDFQEL